jgi:nucleoid DNA-binding protein
MNRRELVAALAERLDTDKRSADAALTAVTDTITASVSKG